jgi:hypothetical protein
MRAADGFTLFVFFPGKRPNSTGRPPRFLKDGTPVSRAEFLLGVVLILLALLGIWYVIRTRSDTLALERDPVSVQGTVLALWVTHRQGRSLPRPV